MKNISLLALYKCFRKIFNFKLLLFFFPFFLHAETVGYRGEILYFKGDIFKDKNAVVHIRDGILFIKDGYVLEAGNYKKLKDKYSVDKIVDYRGRIITPGFIDTHVHYPQLEIMGSYGEQVLDWLNKYTYPAEVKFKDYEYASNIAEEFLELLIKNGTTSAMVFATSHPNSVNAFFEKALAKNLRMITGKVLMDRNADKRLLDTPEKSYKDSKVLIEKWHNKGRLGYAVTPRFAASSTREQLKVAEKLLKEYPDVWLQTHLAENIDEVKWVESLFPERRSYLDVYDHYNLVRNKSIYAHAVHIDDKDFSVLSKKKAAIAFCPTSNLFLGSGLFNLKKSQKYNVEVGLGTDVGAGTSLSLLRTMGEAYKVNAVQKSFVSDPDKINSITPLQNLYLATLGGAKALSLDKYIGSFLPGKEADFIVLNPYAGRISRIKIEENTEQSLNDRLFTMEIIGGERYVEHTYILGKKYK